MCDSSLAAWFVFDGHQHACAEGRQLWQLTAFLEWISGSGVRGVVGFRVDVTRAGTLRAGLVGIGLVIS